ncbi:MAG: hypothetical protein Q9180_007406, partial [Flavoplaca navasiana]
RWKAAITQKTIILTNGFLLQRKILHPTSPLRRPVLPFLFNFIFNHNLSFHNNALSTPITTSSISITSPTGQPLYAWALQTISKPHVVITPIPTDVQVSTITLHAFVKSMDLAISNQDGMRNEIIFKRGYQYRSPTLEEEVERKS